MPDAQLFAVHSRPMEGWNFWWGVAAFFLGGLATQLNGWLAYRRQRKDRDDDAADALRQRREEFELQHLVEVNQVLTDAIEKLSAFSTVARWNAHLRDTNSLDEAAEQRYEETNRAAELALSKATAQISFILDDSARSGVSDAVGHLLDIWGGLHRDPSRDVAELFQNSGAAYELLGQRVRVIYAGRTGV